MIDEETTPSAEPDLADEAESAPEADAQPEIEAETPSEPSPVAVPAAAPQAAKSVSGPEANDTSVRGLKKTRVGVVVSDSMSKTIVVKVTRRVPHPEFKKIVKRSSTFYAHDEKGEAKLGDKVRIIETRPLSKLKRWRLLDVLAH